MTQASDDDTPDFHYKKFFASTTGVALPQKFVSELEPAAIVNRNTYFIAYFDECDRLRGFDKMVYGERAAFHRYSYDAEGRLRRAVLLPEGEDESSELSFDEAGRKSL